MDYLKLSRSPVGYEFQGVMYMRLLMGFEKDLQQG